MILDRIVAHKRREVARRRQIAPLARLQDQGAGRTLPRDLVAALRGDGVRLIAEVKRASPSKGTLCPNLDPVSLAATYVANGAAAISVLTEAHFFQGHLDHLADIRQAVRPAVPLLRKDFVLDPYQVYESYAYGADALLLIVGILADEQLAELLSLTHCLGMTALVEVHDEHEIARALHLRPRVVGINNRDLRTFDVDLGAFARLRPLLPDDVVAVAASGVRHAADVRRLAAMRADAVLVGEALVTAPDVGKQVAEMVSAGAARPGTERTDCCAGSPRGGE